MVQKLQLSNKPPRASLFACKILISLSLLQNKRSCDLSLSLQRLFPKIPLCNFLSCSSPEFSFTALSPLLSALTFLGLFFAAFSEESGRFDPSSTFTCRNETNLAYSPLRRASVSLLRLRVAPRSIHTARSANQRPPLRQQGLQRRGMPAGQRWQLSGSFSPQLQWKCFRDPTNQNRSAQHNPTEKQKNFLSHQNCFPFAQKYSKTGNTAMFKGESGQRLSQTFTSYFRFDFEEQRRQNVQTPSLCNKLAGFILGQRDAKLL